MNEKKQPAVGTILWHDLTVVNAPSVKDFYCQVVGWSAAPHEMGEYHDFDIQTADGEVVAGICHARGENANLPAQWLTYIVVADTAESARRCVELGGKVLDGPRSMGDSSFCVIQDPAGAVLALIQM